MAGRTDSDPRFPDLRRHRVAGARDSEAEDVESRPDVSDGPGRESADASKLPPFGSEDGRIARPSRPGPPRR